MTILADISIRALSEALYFGTGRHLIDPFTSRRVAHGMSYGLSCCGYDVRLDQGITLSAKSFCIGSTMERFFMPPTHCAHVRDKSTWARRGLLVGNTVLEPSWSGFLTLELFNHSNMPITIEPGTPIAQVQFEKLDQKPEQVYAGKYQDAPRGPQAALYEKED